MSAGLILGGAFLTALMLVSTPAGAHPFGEPQTARLSAKDSQVTLWWNAPPDDLLLLGGTVGALPARRTVVFDSSSEADTEPVEPSDAELIASSREVAAYLDEHLAVRQDGQECPAEVSLEHLVEEGALVVFTCPHPVDEVEVEITMLTDFHAAYRTAAFGEGTSVPDRALYTIDETVITWFFHRTGDEQQRGSVHVSTWATAAVLSALFGSVAWVWRRTRAVAP